MKKNLWLAPPKYRGAKSNRRILRSYSQMAYGLSILAVQYPEEAFKLGQIGDELSLTEKTVSRQANIEALTTCIFEDFIFLRDLIAEKCPVTAIDTAFAELNTDLQAMTGFLEEETTPPLSEIADRRVAKFIAKTEKVKTLYQMAKRSLSSAEKKRNALMSIEDGKVIPRRKMRIAQLDSAIATQTEALAALSSIADKLELLSDYAKMSPALAKTINRKIKLKTLCDISYQPIKSQTEREKLNSELYYIIKNVKFALGQEKLWDNILTTDQNENKDAQQEIFENKAKSKIQKPKTTSAQEVKQIIQ